MFCLLLDLKIKFFAVRIYEFLILFKNCNFNNFNFCHVSFFLRNQKSIDRIKRASDRLF